MRKIKKIDLSKDEKVIEEELKHNIVVLLSEYLKDCEPVNEAHKSLLAKLHQLCESH